MDRRKVILGSRASRLAVIQTELVRDYLRKAHPELETEIITMETTGDRRLDVTLDKIGGKGLFVKELDRALLEGRIDLAVHCLKDMPMEESPEIPILAYSHREDPRDVLVLPAGAEAFPPNGVIGCSSFRRTIQAKKLFPNATFKHVRGNVITRLQKLDAGEFDALILAAAGLNRLGMQERISRYFSVDEILPASGQGILVIQGRKGEDYGFLDGYEEKEDYYLAKAERAYIKYLNGGCSSPIASHGEIRDGKIHLKGLYYLFDKDEYVIGELDGPMEEAEQIGICLAKKLQETWG